MGVRAPEHPFRRNYFDDEKLGGDQRLIGNLHFYYEAEEANALLRLAQHARARLFAKVGRTRDLIVELAPRGLGSESVGRTQRLADCGPEETACREAFAALEKVAPHACWPAAGQMGGIDCSVQSVDFVDVSVNVERRGSGGYAETIIFGVKKSPSGGYSIRGFGWEPRDSKECVGQFETDKIVSVTDKTVTVERTTWCKEIKKRQEAGVSVVIEIPPGLPLEPHVGDTMRIFAKQSDVSVAVTGRMRNITIKNPLVTELSVPEGLRYSRGEVLDWQFAASRAQPADRDAARE